jgi:RimJ/RimL family protein N-acetyltransferase
VKPFLETERMILRQFDFGDVEDVLALDSDPAVRVYVDDGDPVDREHAAEAVEHWMGYYERSEIFGFWAAIEKSTGRFLGWFHFRPAEGAPIDEPELGYRLVSSAWGLGLAAEGSIALIDKGFESSLVTRVVASTLAAHVASRRVMEKAGLRHVRTFPTEWPVRLPGDELGEVEYAITRAEWEAASQT